MAPGTSRAVTMPARSSLVMDASFEAEAEAVARVAIDLVRRGLAAD